MKYAKTLGSIALAALLVSGFSGCSEKGEAVTGYYLDSAVQGVDYTTSDGGSGQTGADGSFHCNTNSVVTFKIGNLVLRTLSGVVNGQKIIETDDKIITLLQSIDADGDSSNGIQVTAEVKTAVAAWLGDATSIDINTTSTSLNNSTSLQTALTDAGVTGTQDVNLTTAQAHVATTIVAEAATSTDAVLGTQTTVGDAIYYKDYKGEMRKAPKNAAAAEYHTGTGYGSTLFDSPKNKCQNCHNELYDTWKDSMHGKSWTDPIFQSKFQDFLRTHINKIGEDKTGSNPDGLGAGIVYSEAKILGVAKTCIKCHAPGAYYANDFTATLTVLKASGVTTTDLNSSKENNQSNLATTTTTYDATKSASVVATSHTNGKLYQLTYQIGHESNIEGISCAFCHSIETPRMMNSTNGYTLKGAMRSGPHGPVVRAAGAITFDTNSSSSTMNNFFRLWGPEKPVDYNSTSKAADNAALRSTDGRYGMTNKDTNGTNGKVHYTGGPFYGPYGVSGKANENSTDTTNRLAHISSDFNETTNNHFGMTGAITTGNAGDHGKSLCLTCHQRSAGARAAAGQFMELCSTQMAVTVGSDTPENDSLTSPKCQKCHMERIKGVLLHKWARPDLRYAASDFTDANLSYALTPQMDEADTTISAGNNPQRDGWFNSHAFLGASKTGHKTSATAKIKSGFLADINKTVSGNTLTINTSLKNLTAHMFPGAHPMRRVFTRLIVTESNGTVIESNATRTGLSTFGNISNSVQPMSGKTLHSSALSSVPVNDAGNSALAFPGKTADLNGAVTSQKFDGTSVTIFGTDATIKSQEVNSSGTYGTVTNAAITTDSNASYFTRIYGHETGTKYNTATGMKSSAGTFIVRPGFDSNNVASDNRLSPNETETYTTHYDITGKTGVTATYKVYYMQKGANGKFIAGSDGFLNQTSSDAKKFLVTEVFTKTVTQ